jgi:GAF domain-containing protein
MTATTLDERFATNPLITGDPNLRLYAGAPLVTSAGQAMGTICVVDSVARSLEPAKIEMLEFLSKQVIQRLKERPLRQAPSPSSHQGFGLGTIEGARVALNVVPRAAT